MENNKISVILPVYNGEKFVGKAIESILNQTYKNIELIIVNDCSEDNTLQIISNYAVKDSRIKILSNKTNQQLPKTLNNGFRMATGEYFTWTSDDNLYHSTALARMAEILDTKPDIGLVYTDFSIVDMEGNLIKEVKEGEPEEIRFRDNVGACFLYRHSLADIVGEYNPEAFLAEDYEFFIRCYKHSHGQFYHIPEDLYDYGRHDANLSATRQKDIAHQAFVVMDMHFDFLLSECRAQKDRYQFFYELLALLTDSEEKEQQRQRFYNLDPTFAKADRKLRRNQKIKSVFSFPFLIASKLKSKVLFHHFFH